MARPSKSDPRWRSVASAAVMAEAVAVLAPRWQHLRLRGLDLPDQDLPVLLGGEADAGLMRALSDTGSPARVWLRHLPTDHGSASHHASTDAARLTANPWPTDGPFAAALLRLPRAKDELDMMLHAAAARVVAGGVIAVYGANDEGIRSVPARMEPLLGEVEATIQRAHCRVIVACRPERDRKSVV